MGIQAPLPKKEAEPGGGAPQFSAHVYWGQTAAWIKMPLGTEVGLGLRHIVFDVYPATPRKQGTPPHPIFGPCLLWPNGLMDEDAACTEVDLGPGHIVLDGVAAPAKEAQHPLPVFGPCLLWPRSPISTTAELLFYTLQYFGAQGDFLCQSSPIWVVIYSKALSIKVPNFVPF